MIDGTDKNRFIIGSNSICKYLISLFFQPTSYASKTKNNFFNLEDLIGLDEWLNSKENADIESSLKILDAKINDFANSSYISLVLYPSIVKLLKESNKIKLEIFPNIKYFYELLNGLEWVISIETSLKQSDAYTAKSNNPNKKVKSVSSNVTETSQIDSKSVETLTYDWAEIGLV
jgi:hypothetical protein